MRIPILINGTPSLIRDLPVIRLDKGNWKVVVENHIDSVLHPVPNVPIHLAVPTNFQLNFITKGTERNLNIYCEKII